MNHKAAHIDKVLIVTMFKHLTDSAIPVLNKLRKLRSNQYTTYFIPVLLECILERI